MKLWSKEETDKLLQAKLNGYQIKNIQIDKSRYAIKRKVYSLTKNPKKQALKY